LIKEIVAVDPATVKFSMCAPDPAFPQKAAFSAFGIRSKANIEATGGGGEILEKPIGTGAYKIESWKRGDSITMVRNDEYWGTKGIAKKLVFRWSPEAAQRLLELQSGAVDGIDNPGPDDFEKIKNNPDLQLIDREALNVMFIALNNTKPPFDNVQVRQAIAMGIDRDRIVKTFYPAGSVAASHFTPCAIENACAGEEWYKFDAAKAKALLKEAGFENGFETKLYYRDVVRGYLPQVAQVAQDIQDQLQKNLNIKATIEVQESGTLIDNAQTGRLEMYLLGWGADYPHITNFLDYHFGKSQKMFGDSYPDIYNLLVEGAKISDTKKAEPIYAKANKAIKDLVPMVPVAHGGSGVAFRKDVKNAHASPLTNEYFGVMDPGGRDTLVWMQNAEPISLYCNDETDGESLRACEQVIESLLAFEPGGTKVEPGLAESCDPNADLTEWVCKLRKGVKFHDGAELHANDVVMSWGVAWDAANKFHKGNTGAFEYFSTLWGSLLNVPPAK